MISFHASCNKDGCHSLFEGAEDIPRYTEHMTKVHGLSIGRNCGVFTPAWLKTKPYTFKAPRAGLPPAGKRRDAYLAAMEQDTQQEAA